MVIPALRMKSDAEVDWMTGAVVDERRTAVEADTGSATAEEHLQPDTVGLRRDKEGLGNDEKATGEEVAVGRRGVVSEQGRRGGKEGR